MAGDIEYKAKLVFIPGQPNPLDACGCNYCHAEWSNTMDELDPDGWLFRLRPRMIVCPDCGNKRCPRATYHGHDCSGSNEPGQPLSVYGGFRLPNTIESEN
ncbi:hypothetical protein [Prescottella equi]|uniref:hypothetical protein n=1 Tax=Rhodococcus hoagii TaxID=43767 RepID=UPI000A233184|nr:hypothetical protein [Prescottella equi]ORJ99844.1 hypothetical protein A6F58_00610 [Prescottella equi]